ncbi:MAG: YfhO family protein, partial [Thermomicrobiales bacterium]|nr:YfhO family protein [Thermomicrobiales bacterium]
TGSRAGGLVAGLTFAFGGFVAWHVPHLSPLSSLSWLPWMLFAYYQAVRRRHLLWVALGAASFGMLVLAGHALTILQSGYLLGLLGVVVALVTWRSDPRRAGWALGAAAAIGLLGTGLAAIQLLPSWELSGETSRAGLSWAEASGSSFRPLWLLTTIAPDYFSPNDPALYWATGDPAETNMYLGIIPLFLAVLGVACADRQHRRMVGGILATGAVCLVLAFGSHGLLYRLVYEIVPGFDHVRRPGNFIALVTLSIGLLAAFGVRALEERHRADGVLAARSLGRFLLIGTGLLIVGLVVAALRRHSADEAVWLDRVRNIEIDLVRAILLALLAIVLVYARVVWRFPASALVVALVLIVSVDVGLANANRVYADHESRPDAYIGPDWAAAPEDPFVRWLLDRQAEAAPDQFRIYPDQAGSIWINGPLVWDLQSINGYSVLWPLTYQELFNLAVGNPGSPIYDLLNIRYVPVTRPLADLYPGFDLSGFQLAMDGWMQIYENTDAMPRAWIAEHWVVQPEDAVLAWMTTNAGSLRDTVVVSDSPVEGVSGSAPVSGGTANIVEYGNTRVVVRASHPTAGYLVLADPYYPGWSATVDGEAAEITRADHALRAVWLPEGTHEVVFTYHSTHRTLGTFVSLVSLIAIVAIAGWSVIRPRRPSGRAVIRSQARAAWK